MTNRQIEAIKDAREIHRHFTDLVKLAADAHAKWLSAQVASRLEGDEWPEEASEAFRSLCQVAREGVGGDK